MTIPNDLKRLKQWSYSYSLDELKRPYHTDYKPNGALSLTEAINKAGKDKYIGFYVTEDDPFVLVDIDHVNNTADPFTELPFALAQLLQSRPTYAEVSPSGKGIRAVFKLPSAEDKKELEGSTFYIRDGDNKREAQINIGPPWMTITMQPTPFSMTEIATVDVEQLDAVFNIKRGKRLPLDEIEQKVSQVKLPAVSDIRYALLRLPLDQNPRIQRAYKKVFGHEYTHYDYWLKVLMALHNYGEVSGDTMSMLKLATDWSSLDEIAFKSEEDIIKRWSSFNKEETIISYKTIFGLFYSSTLRWPMPRKQKKEDIEKQRPILPMNSEYKNFQALMMYYNIKIYRNEIDNNMLYLTADPDIVSKYFIKVFRVNCYFGEYYGPFVPDSLSSAMFIMCQDLGFVGVTRNTIQQFVSAFLINSRRLVNFIRKYFDTPFEQLPLEYQENAHTYHSSTMEKLFECIQIDYMTDNPTREKELYYKYYKAWWMGMIRNIYYQDQIHTNNCVLLLTGVEQIRKTSHFKYLLPSFLRENIAFTTHGFSRETSVRDVCKLSASNLMIVWDELEQYLNDETEANFKKVIDNNEQKFIDKYQIIPISIRPIAIYGATSNIREFKLSDAGSRRLFHIPVKWVDTDTIETINWHRVINDLKAEVKTAIKKDEVPWLLSNDDLEYQVTLHKPIRALNVIDIALDEIYDTNTVLPEGYTVIQGVNRIQVTRSKRVMTTKEVVEMLQNWGVPPIHLNRAAVVQALKRLCGTYTRTRRKVTRLVTPACIIDKGLAIQSQYKRWIMPPMRPHVFEQMFAMFRKDED